MHSMQTLERVLINLPISVFMMGFQSDTRTLASHGWQFALEQTFDRDVFWVLIKHNTSDGFRMLAKGSLGARSCYELANMLMNSINSDAFYRDMRIDIQYIGDIYVRTEVMTNGMLRNFKPWDVSTPEFIETKHIQSLSDLNVFRTFDTSKELVIDPNDVEQMMSLILKSQKPVQQSILRRKEMDARIEANARPKQQMHLQLVSNL